MRVYNDDGDCCDGARFMDIMVMEGAVRVLLMPMPIMLVMAMMMVMAMVTS